MLRALRESAARHPGLFGQLRSSALARPVGPPSAPMAHTPSAAATLPTSAGIRLSDMRGLAAAALACVALCACVGPAAAIDWCEPRQLATQMPCPNATHCCSVWVSRLQGLVEGGILVEGGVPGRHSSACMRRLDPLCCDQPQGFCGPGTHFCQPGHCAGGPCQGAPLDLSNQRRPPPRASPPPPPRASRPPPPRASPAPSMPPKQPSNPFELPADTSMEVEEDPTGLGGGAGGSSQPTPDSLPPTLNPALTPPLLPLPLIRECECPGECMPAGLPPPSSHPIPSSPPAPIAAEVCGLAQPDIDLWGSDLPEGRIGEVDNLELCCDACRARVGCGAYTYNPRRRMCYLKRGAGHNRRVREGWASALMPGPSPPPSPPPPLSPPPPPPPPAPALPQLREYGRGLWPAERAALSTPSCSRLPSPVAQPATLRPPSLSLPCSHLRLCAGQHRPVRGRPGQRDHRG